MPDQRSDEPLLVLGLSGERADKTVFISGVDFLVHNTEASDKPIVPLSLHGTRSIENLFSRVVDNLHL